MELRSRVRTIQVLLLNGRTSEALESVSDLFDDIAAVESAAAVPEARWQYCLPEDWELWP